LVKGGITVAGPANSLFQDTQNPENSGHLSGLSPNLHGVGGCCRWMEVLGSVTSQSSASHNTANGAASLSRSPKPPTPPPRYLS